MNILEEQFNVERELERAADFLSSKSTSLIDIGMEKLGYELYNTAEKIYASVAKIRDLSSMELKDRVKKQHEMTAAIISAAIGGKNEYS